MIVLQSVVFNSRFHCEALLGRVDSDSHSATDLVLINGFWVFVII